VFAVFQAANDRIASAAAATDTGKAFISRQKKGCRPLVALCITPSLRSNSDRELEWWETLTL
jgi:hypothetical protein